MDNLTPLIRTITELEKEMLTIRKTVRKYRYLKKKQIKEFDIVKLAVNKTGKLIYNNNLTEQELERLEFAIDLPQVEMAKFKKFDRLCQKMHTLIFDLDMNDMSDEIEQNKIASTLWKDGHIPDDDYDDDDDDDDNDTWWKTAPSE